MQKSLFSEEKLFMTHTKWVINKAQTCCQHGSLQWGDSTINVSDTQAGRQRVALVLSTSTTETHSFGTSSKTPGLF